MKICVIYDCLYPWTVGGAEKWYRSLAEAYAAQGHEVSYLTMRQWEEGEAPILPGVEVVPVAPRMQLYAAGRRRILPPLAFGAGVLLHLLRKGHGYSLIHTASFPFFSLIAMGLLRPFWGYRIAVDWHEVWTREYWSAYLGRLGVIGWFVQRWCARIQQTTFSFSRLHGQRLASLGKTEVNLLSGEYTGEVLSAPEPPAEPAQVVYAGRMIAEKRVMLLVEALALAMEQRPDLHATLIGRGPELDKVRARIEGLGLAARIALPGFVPARRLEQVTRGATVIVQPSGREGYGMVVVEASARGVPCVVVAGEDNAAVELIEPGENGMIAVEPTPRTLADAILAAAANPDLRDRTARWFAANCDRLSFKNAFAQITATLWPETTR